MKQRTAVLLALVFIGLCAVPAMADLPSPPMIVEGRPTVPDGLVLFLDGVTDLFFILIALAILGKVRTFRLRTLLVAAAVALVAGFASDFVGDVLSREVARWVVPHGVLPGLVHTGGRYGWPAILARGLIPAPLIFLANFAIGRRLLGLSRKQAAFLGLVMGVCTTPLLLEVLTQGQMHLILRETRQIDSHQFGPRRSPAKIPYFISAGNAIYSGVIPLLLAGAAAAFGLADIALLYLWNRGRELRRGRVAAAVACLFVLGFCAAYGAHYEDVRTNIDEARRDGLCESHKGMIRSVVFAFRERYGKYPGSLDALVPEFLRDNSWLYCPGGRHGKGAGRYAYQRPPEQTVQNLLGSKAVSCMFHPEPPPAYNICMENQARIEDALISYRLKNSGVPTLDYLAKTYPQFRFSPHCPSDPRGPRAISYTLSTGGQAGIPQVHCPFHPYYRTPRPNWSLDCRMRRDDITYALLAYRQDYGDFPPNLPALVPGYLESMQQLQCDRDTRGPSTLSYYFPRFAPRAPLESELEVVTCSAHRQNLWRMDYKSGGRRWPIRLRPASRVRPRYR